eukprot:SAG11_NODE_2694_length_3083_cov_4.985255_1_plen_83_part_00
MIPGFIGGIGAAKATTPRRVGGALLGAGLRAVVAEEEWMEALRQQPRGRAEAVAPQWRRLGDGGGGRGVGGVAPGCTVPTCA